jgi:hypothetical protein
MTWQVLCTYRPTSPNLLSTSPALAPDDVAGTVYLSAFLRDLTTPSDSTQRLYLANAPDEHTLLHHSGGEMHNVT